MEHVGTLWYTLIQSGTLWYTLVHFGTLWYTLVHTHWVDFTFCENISDAGETLFCTEEKNAQYFARCKNILDAGETRPELLVTASGNIG